MTACGLPTVDRRRTFWSTQPAAGPEIEGACGVCASPGLVLVTRCDSPSNRCGDTPHQSAPCGPVSACDQPRTITTTDWLRGLALNMLLTDAKEPDRCEGWAPGTRGGHWSESFMSSGRPVGSRLRQITTAASIADLTNLIRAVAEDTLRKLVAYGVATSVDVTVTYIGGQVFRLEAVIYTGDQRKTRVGISASSQNDTLRWVI